MSKIIGQFLGSLDNLNTARAYGADLSEFSKYLSQSGQDILASPDIETYFEVPSIRALSASRRRRILSALKAFYKWCVSLDLVDRDPAKNVQHAYFRGSDREIGRRVRPLTKRDVDILLEFLGKKKGPEQVRNLTLISFFLSVPLRRSTASKMDFEHLSLDDTLPFLRVADSRGGLSILYSLPERVVHQLQIHCEHYGIASGPLWRSFSRRNPGGRLTPTSIYRIVRGTAVAAGLPEIGTHTLRHTGCTLAIEAGASIQAGTTACTS